MFVHIISAYPRGPCLKWRAKWFKISLPCMNRLDSLLFHLGKTCILHSMLLGSSWDSREFSHIPKYCRVKAHWLTMPYFFFLAFMPQSLPKGNLLSTRWTIAFGMSLHPHPQQKTTSLMAWGLTILQSNRTIAWVLKRRDMNMIKLQHDPPWHFFVICI